jgi:hypothetical protein
VKPLVVSETATVSEVLAMERKLIVETGLTGVLINCT